MRVWACVCERTRVRGVTDPCSALHSQAQGVDGDLYKSVEACQKVVKRHTILAEGTTQRTLQQLTETNSTMEVHAVKNAHES